MTSGAMAVGSWSAMKMLSFSARTSASILTMKAVAAELSISDIKIIIGADNKGLPPYLEHAEEIISAMSEVSGSDAPRGLTGRKIGDWVKGQQLETCKRMLAQCRA